MQYRSAPSPSKYLWKCRTYCVIKLGTGIELRTFVEQGAYLNQTKNPASVPLLCPLTMSSLSSWWAGATPTTWPQSWRPAATASMWLRRRAGGQTVSRWPRLWPSSRPKSPQRRTCSLSSTGVWTAPPFTHLPTTVFYHQCETSVATTIFMVHW
jgi:hypothetical protein